MKINIENQIIEVVIVRKNIKNIYFRFKDDLKLYVSCHKLVTDREIEKLIKNNYSSIVNMYHKQVKKSKSENKFAILGQELNIIIDDQLKNVFIDGNYIFGSSETEIEKYYLREAKKFISVRFERCYNLFSDLPKCSLRFRKMKTRWGVCNTKLNIVTINTELYKYDVSLIDYVIIHELCHFKEANHSPRFWNEVKKYYPNYKQARKLLKEGV